MSHRIPILPDEGDASPVLRLRDEILPGEYRRMRDFLDRAGTQTAIEIAVAFCTDGLEGDWSKHPRFDETPAWPALSAVDTARGLEGRLQVLSRLDGDVLSAAVEAAKPALGLDEEEEGN